MFGVKELLLIFFTVGTVLSRDTDYCYAHIKEPYLRMGSKTTYSVISGGRTRYQSIPNCSPIQIWMLLRHGTRYPGLEKIKKMKNLAQFRDKIIENHEKRGYGRLCDADLQNLKLWRLPSEVTVEAAETLNQQGAADLYSLGKRVRSHFPELFPTGISENTSSNHEFRAADGKSTMSSRVAFMSGLFDRMDTSYTDIYATKNLFASYKNCPRWETEVANNPEVLKEATKFFKGPQYQAFISNITRRLGFLSNMSTDTIYGLWDICRYEKAWKVNKLSPWCAVFSKEELKVLEYHEDLTDYYKRGHGHEFNLRLGCPLLQDMIQHFEKLETADYYKAPKGIFNIGHSGSFYLFMAAMGFAKDPYPLLASDFLSKNKRRWSTSEIGSFTANFAAVFYKCKSIRSPNKVAFYIAEKPVFYKGCDNGLCDWEYLKKKHEKAALDCNADFCYLNNAGLFDVVHAVFWIVLFVIAIMYHRWLINFIFRSSFWLKHKFCKCLRIRYRTSSRYSLQIA